VKITIPELSLVVLIGAFGSGKSTFAARHFLGTETVSSDACRALLTDDPNDQGATSDAFELLHAIASKRLERGRLTVVDATNVQKDSRAPLVSLARRQHCLPVAIIFDLPEKICVERNKSRADRNFGPHVIRRHQSDLKRSLHGLRREGFRYVYVLSSEEEVAAAEIERQPSWTDRRTEHGPFDIIGDVHGCADELEVLLDRLGYGPGSAEEAFGGMTRAFAHPDGRKVVFLGDLVDRGPRVLDVLRLAKLMVDAGSAMCIPGNHDIKLMRKLRGKNVQITHGLDVSLAAMETIPEEARPTAQTAIADFVDGMISHFVLDNGRLVVAHAGMKESMQGRASGGVREFALYGETTGETDEFGLPVRYNWAADYRGRAMVVYGHTPVPAAEWLNRTINIDTGCVFGGALTALRYPEGELVSVPASRTYAEPARPFVQSPAQAAPSGLTAQQEHDRALNIDDVIGKRVVQTRLAGNLTIAELNAAAALEVMSRFAIDPRWLIYLPPTMSPAEASNRLDLLEHPEDVFAYYRTEGVERVVCEEKHMGSRAILVVCRDEETGRERFGVEAAGAAYTRTGRALFDDRELQAKVLNRLQAAVTAAGLWEELDTRWILLDCELMPWSAKAQGLLRGQYAAVGAAARVGLSAAVEALASAAVCVPDAQPLLARALQRRELIDKYVNAYRQYCWPVQTVDDLKIAPFHLLASEKRVHIDRDHAWHMDRLARIAAADPSLVLATAHHVVDLNDDAQVEAAYTWWSELTAGGSEGIVVKPLAFLAQGRRGTVQPAIKCRGREYLRIIYGPDYTEAENLTRLRRRGLAKKRSLAFREFALGTEGLERFVSLEPLRRVHECAFAVLALESEPVDPRL
jgi:protein phosphatase